jgi:pimeloyl-ACP methyl ester carboxylesterase
MTSIELFTADDVPAVLHDLGGEGPALLLTHGNGLNAGMWATVVPYLTSTFHCYGLDFRGHGASRPPSDEFSVDRPLFDAEVLAAVDAIGGGPIAGAGHSLGGATLLRAELERPGTFARLWVFEPVLVPTGYERPDAPMALVEISRRRRMFFGSQDEVFERFRSKPPFDRCEPAAVRGYVELGTRPAPEGGVRLSCLGETEARIYEGADVFDFGRLGEVACPVAVARGLQVLDANSLPPAVAPLIAEAASDGHLEEYEQLTHFGPMEDGATVAAAIAAHCAL